MEASNHTHYEDSHTGQVTGGLPTKVYLDFLKEVGLPMTGRSKSFARYSHEKMLEVQY